VTALASNTLFAAVIPDSRSPRRFNTTLRELQRWNSRADLDRLRIGQELYVYVEVGGTGSGSRGTPNRGRLRGGIQLSDGAGYTVRNPERAYAVPGTIAALRNGIARVTARFVEVPDIVIHDLSYERGGSMRPHASHQNGLDVDASYYHLDAGELSEWRDVEPEELDVRLQWYLFKSWIDLGQVEYLFVDWDLQAVLYDYAAARGASPEQLDEWFQYPTRGSQGILRHEPGARRPLPRAFSRHRGVGGYFGSRAVPYVSLSIRSF
jgi:hypothetical protein